MSGEKILIFFKFIYLLWERQREQKWEEGAERKGESQEGSTQSAQSPMWGSNSKNPEIMTQAEIKSHTLNQTSHPGAPVNGENLSCLTVVPWYNPHRGEEKYFLTAGWRWKFTHFIRSPLSPWEERPHYWLEDIKVPVLHVAFCDTSPSRGQGT